MEYDKRKAMTEEIFKLDIGHSKSLAVMIELEFSLFFYKPTSLT